MRSEKPAYKLRFRDFIPGVGLVNYARRCADSGARINLVSQDNQFRSEPMLPVPENFGSGDYEDKCFNRYFLLVIYNLIYPVLGAVIATSGNNLESLSRT